MEDDLGFYGLGVSSFIGGYKIFTVFCYEAEGGFFDHLVLVRDKGQDVVEVVSFFLLLLLLEIYRFVFFYIVVLSLFILFFLILFIKF